MVIHFLEQEAVQPLNGLSELVPNAVQSNDQEIEKNSRKKKRSKKNKSRKSKQPLGMPGEDVVMVEFLDHAPFDLASHFLN